MTAFPQDVIDTVVTLVCHRNRLLADEADDFRSEVLLRLVEDDYALLRKYSGKGSLKAYLAVVINRLLLDYRRKEWGRWRPSAAATRLGPVAIRLEELTKRDHLSFDEACIRLRERGFEESEKELERIWAMLPERTNRHVDDLDDYQDAPSGGGDPESEALAGEREARMATISDLMADHRARLSEEDGMILSLRFEKGLSVAKVARALNLEEGPLRRRRLPQLLAGLREALQEHGIDAATVRKVLDPSYADPANRGKMSKKDVSERDG